MSKSITQVLQESILLWIALLIELSNDKDCLTIDDMKKLINCTNSIISALECEIAKCEEAYMIAGAPGELYRPKI